MICVPPTNYFGTHAICLQDPRFNPEVDEKLGFSTSAVMCLPVCNYEGEIIGVVQLMNDRKPGFESKEFSETDVKVRGDNHYSNMFECLFQLGSDNEQLVMHIESAYLHSTFGLFFLFDMIVVASLFCKTWISLIHYDSNKRNRNLRKGGK